MLGDVPPYDEQHYSGNDITAINRLNVRVETNQTEFTLVELNESYHIDFQGGAANLVAANNFGLARGLATLLQLVEIDGSDYKAYSVANCTVDDFPSFVWREIMLDTNCNYPTVNELKHQLDTFSMAKFNLFHWHVVDDTSYPIRFNDAPQRDLNQLAFTKDQIYTMEDAHDIVAYAFERGIYVFFELEGPGHAGKWRRVDEQLCGNCPNASQYTLNILNEKVYDIYRGALREILVDGPYKNQPFKMTPVIHLGGDEVDTKCWEQDPNISAWMKQRGITSKDVWREF